MQDGKRALYDDDHESFRGVVKAFIDRSVVPHVRRWEDEGIIDRQFWLDAGEAGLLGTMVPEELGGGGVDDPRFAMIIQEEIAKCGYASVAVALSIQNEVVLPYLLELCDDEQRARWLPGVCAGTIVLAVAITEPGTGSDMAAIRTSYRHDGEELILNGAKTFISNGINADLVVVAARRADGLSDSEFSLLVVERSAEGFERGRKLEKIGLQAQDTAELSFSEVRVPRANLLGTEGGGFRDLRRFLVNERLATAAGAINHAEQYLEWTLEHTKQRNVFGAPLASLQNTRFTLSELATELTIARVFVDDCIRRSLDGELTEARAAMAKWWCTELRNKVADRGLQLHGGYGYMREYPISRGFVDSRIETIYAGTTEIMKEIVARDLIGRL